MLVNTCLHLAEQCLYCPLAYESLTSSITFSQSCRLYGRIVSSVTGPGRFLFAARSGGGGGGICSSISKDAASDEDLAGKMGDSNSAAGFAAGDLSSLRGIS